jgi:2-iminobutanoate/2-iminopropanoate deaminase
MPDSPRSWTPVTLPAGHKPPVGAYSPALVAGDLVFVSGQVPKDPVTGELLGTTVEDQTRAVLANVARALGYAGASLADVVSVNAYLADIADWDRFNAVYREHFEPPYPTRTTVGAELHGFLVEISAVARLRERK